MPKVESFWNWHERRTRKQEVVIRVPPPKDLEPTQEIEVTEDVLSETGVHRFINRVLGRK